MSRPSLLRTIDAQRADRRRALDEEVAEYRGRTMEWRAQALEQLVRAGWRILQTRKEDRERVLSLADDPATDYHEKLRKRRGSAPRPD